MKSLYHGLMVKTQSQPDRPYLLLFLTLAVVTLILQVASLGPLQSSLWGVHFYSFLHPATAAACGLLFIVGSAAVLRRRREGDLPSPLSGFVDRRPVIAAAGFAVACGLVFWLFRSQQLLLGDALPLKISIAGGDDFHPRQPLTMWLQQAFYQSTGGLFRGEGIGDEGVAQRAIALGSVIAGVLYAVVVLALGRLFIRGTSQSAGVGWLVAFVLLTQGFVQLFFGYVENYTYYTLAIGVYLWLAMRYVEGLSPLLWAGLALILALALHLSSAVLFPSFAVLCVWALRSRERRVAASRDVFILAVMFLGVNQLLVATRDYNLLFTLFDVSGKAFGESPIPNYMWTMMHVRDFINEQLLIGPVGLFALAGVSIIAIRSERRWGVGAVFFLVVCFTYLAASWMAQDSNLGYARNWDLLAPSGVCYTAAVLFFLVRSVRQSGALTRLLLFVLLFSILHTAPWIWNNHREALALERMKTLPLGFGRTETVVANWHLERGERDEAREWFKRALTRNPRNAVAHAFVGMLFSQDERFEEAAEHYRLAVERRPDKVEYRNNYLLTLIELERWEDALPHLRWFTANKPEEVHFWRLSSQVFLQLERDDDEAKHVRERLLEFAERDLADDPNDEDAVVTAGIYLVLLHREEEAFNRFAQALRVNPNSLGGLFNVGSLYVQVGRVDDARPFLEKFIELYPDHPNVPWAREQLAR